MVAGTSIEFVEIDQIAVERACPDYHQKGIDYSYFLSS
jgi:hypothetical protein